MRILIAPLNWGLGHATRCIPLIEHHLRQGDEVVLGGDGASLTLLKKRFPSLQVLALAPLELRYSKRSSQVGAMIRALPQLLRSAIADHRLLAEYLRYEAFDLIISDNRFGLYTRKVRCAYMTHQLTIPLPRMWRWLEPLAAGMHRRIIKRYDECMIPDYEAAPGLAGRLSHPAVLPRNARYIGPLSRFAGMDVQKDESYEVVAVLSGLEPQRSILEQEICETYKDKKLLVVRGKTGLPPTVSRHGKITLVPWLDDKTLAAYMRGAERLVMRSGYTSIMDMEALGLTDKTEWHPTPGQPEQEYLAELLRQRNA